jgi:hypothetical protein
MQGPEFKPYYHNDKKRKKENTGLAARLPVTFGGRHSSLKCGVKMGIYVPFKT